MQLEGKDRIGNRWVSAIPRLLLLELLVEVLVTTDGGVATVTVVPLPGEADLLLGVALLPARGQVGRSGVGRVVATFPPRPVVRQLDVDLLVGGCDRLLLLDVAVRRREDAEGDGDSCFKIQLDCPVRTELSCPLPCSQTMTVLCCHGLGKGRRKESSGFFRGERSRKKREKREGPYQLDGTPSVWTLTVRSSEDWGRGPGGMGVVVVVVVVGR